MRVTIPAKLDDCDLKTKRGAPFPFASVSDSVVLNLNRSSGSVLMRKTAKTLRGKFFALDRRL
jgi:hypothetical protein